jgi:MFS family permease
MGVQSEEKSSALWRWGSALKRETLSELPSRSRRLISDHRQRRRSLDRKVSDQSRRGLDWTNFFLADVQVSFGALLAFYLANLGWSKQDVGLVMAVGGLVGVAAQIPGGALADALPWKRALAAVGVLMISGAALILALWPSYTLVFMAATLHGMTAGLVGPAIAAISLGLTGRQGMSLRVGRNFRFAGAGNALTALVTGAVASYLSNSVIFMIAAALCVPTLLALSYIRADEIDYARARNARKHDHSFDLERAVDLFKNRNLMVFAACLMLFQFFNSSLLPVVGQNLGNTAAGMSSLYMAAMLAVPQVVVAMLAPWIGYWSEIRGRKYLLLAGFGFAALRALLFAATGNPAAMIGIQILDGITGAIVTVLTLLVITDLTSGTGRFNLAQGLFGALTGACAAASAGVFGFVAYRFGDVAALLSMAAGIAAGTVLLYAALPETKPAKYEN